MGFISGEFGCEDKYFNAAVLSSSRPVGRMVHQNTSPSLKHFRNL
jgi:hypothetical protein